MTTAPEALPAGVISRVLDPRRTLSFELLGRDEVPSAALTALIGVAAAFKHPSSTRSLAAVA